MFPVARFSCQMPGMGLPLAGTASGHAQGRLGKLARAPSSAAHSAGLPRGPRASQTIRRLTRSHTVSGEVACYYLLLHFYVNFLILVLPQGREDSQDAGLLPRAAEGAVKGEGWRRCHPGLPQHPQAM